MSKVLIVDDDIAVGTVLVALVKQVGLEARAVTSPDAALTLLHTGDVDLLISDLRMPGMDGLTLLRKVRELSPDLPVIMLTAHGTVADAVEAMKVGAADFLTKPFDREEIVYVVKKALTMGQRAAESTPKAAPVGNTMIGSGPVMDAVNKLIDKAAPASATVLIRGESGTGKELVALEIHQRGPRRDHAFVAVHCAALPDTLLESELFGYEKGAFTGATSRKPGRVELAKGGTLLLDEIGDITPTVQVKLLRLLQEGTYERLGGTQTLQANVRFLAATHRDLEQLVADGQFREDLFYRLNVIPLWLPPLRDHPEDIDQLARHFCAKLGPKNGRPDISIEPAALDHLRTHPWPGNVRELQNFIERLIVLSESETIGVGDIKTHLTTPRFSRGDTQLEQSTDLDDARHGAEKDAVLQALKRTNNNRTQAARILGVSRRTLYNKLEQMGHTS